MFQVKFGEFSGYDFPSKYLGYHSDNGWAVYGKTHCDTNGEKSVDEICAVRDSSDGEIEWVAGRFDDEIAASSQDAYDAFIEAFPMSSVLPFF